MPAFQQGFAVVIGRLGSVAQPVGGRFRSMQVLPAIARTPARLGGFKESGDARRMNRTIARDRCGSVGQGQVEIAVGDIGGVGGITKAHFFGKGVGVQPVDKTFAPTSDYGALRIMGMGVDEARQN